MKPAEYERRLVRELCWVCASRTTRSSAQQRQCAHCRCKWSYRRRQLRWKLLEMFAMALTPAEAARRARVSYRTAWIHFLHFERTVRRRAELHDFLSYRKALQKGQLPWREIAPNRDVIRVVFDVEIVVPK